MIQANNVTLRIGKKALFEDVNIKFTEGNCYGLIGANGAGKSTFWRFFPENWSRHRAISASPPVSAFPCWNRITSNTMTALSLTLSSWETSVFMTSWKKKDAIYAKEDFTEEDGIRASELEGEFATMNGWEAESDAATLLISAITSSGFLLLIRPLTYGIMQYEQNRLQPSCILT